MKDDKNVVDVSVPVQKKKKVKPMYLRLLALTVAGAAILGVYMWQSNEVANVRQEYTDKITALENKIDELQKTKGSSDSNETEDDSETSVPTDEVKTNVETAVSSKNYATIESYMSDKVTVIIAASEGLGERTATQTVTDLDYLSKATEPWDFDISSSVLSDWQSGDYGPYFPKQSSLVGRSADGYVVVFVFNDDNKITNVFMSSSDKLL